MAIIRILQKSLKMCWSWHTTHAVIILIIISFINYQFWFIFYIYSFILSLIISFNRCSADICDSQWVNFVSHSIVETPVPTRKMLLAVIYLSILIISSLFWCEIISWSSLLALVLLVCSTVCTNMYITL